MKLNKKGFTLVEIIVSISILAVVLVFMLSSLVRVRSIATYSSLDTQVLITQSTISHKINSDVKKHCGINAITCDSDEECTLTFNDIEAKKIEILAGGKTLKYSDSEETILLKTLDEDEGTFLGLANATNEDYPDLLTFRIGMSAGTDYDIYIYDFYNSIADCEIIDEGSFAYTGGVQEYVVPETGFYKVELWGAGGGNNGGGSETGGAYTSGTVKLNKDEILYIYVGEEGKAGTWGSTSYGRGGSATFNGGGAGGNAGLINTLYAYTGYFGGASGGGATDIRLTSGTWDNSSSLRSRIMVAGGGGGNMATPGYDDSKSHAGGLSGQDGGIYSLIANHAPTYDYEIPARGKGGTQTTGGAVGADTHPSDTTPGKNATGGQFGIGGRGSDSGSGYCNGHSGGGGGYYGGGGSQSTSGNCHSFGGGGGSSFISGHAGSNSVNSSGTHTGSSIHFSGKAFTNTKMIDGAGYRWTNVKGNLEAMPTTDGGAYTSGVGHTGNGYAKITKVTEPSSVEGTDFAYTGGTQSYVVPKTGFYKVELWGAQGYTTSTTSVGMGGYTRGTILLNAGEVLHFYVGEYNSSQVLDKEVFNNGTGYGGGWNGGGATDVRLNSGVWKDAASLRSRIMVAGGGGSGNTNSSTAGSGGGLIASNGGGTTGGTQTSAGTYQNSYSGSGFGLANGGCTGGGGYYGGGGAICANGSGGGSSFISGHNGSNAINSSGAHTGQANHYSGKIFTNTKMIDGKGFAWTHVIGAQEAMPNPSGGYYAAGTGRTGSGYARISYVGANPETQVFAYNGNYQTFVAGKAGKYKIELWGASGGNAEYSFVTPTREGLGGEGAYTSGEITLSSNERLYVYVGSVGESKIGQVQALGGYNGGGNSYQPHNIFGAGGGGGGATDIRTTGGAWNDVTGLRNRIMVAAGGGGSGGYYAVSGGVAGALTGGTGSYVVNNAPGYGATQIAGGVGTAAGTFGAGGNAVGVSNESGGGGGSGYYGGGGSAISGGGGGSSFASGCSGCNAINSAGTHTGTANHYSGKVFTSIIMKSGVELMPDLSGAINIIGNTGNGHAKISFIN